MVVVPLMPPPDSGPPLNLLRLEQAGDAKPAWVTLLTTEHYNLQTQRAATIAESNGRASVFLGAVSAGLIALAFQGSGHARSAGTTVFDALVLSTLSFLGTVTFLRCVEISVDDWQFSIRIDNLRAAYAQLVPQLAELLLSATGAEQGKVMLTSRRQPFQQMLSVAGSIGVITSVLIGADVGVVIYGLHSPLYAGLVAGVIAGLVGIWASVRFHHARWIGAASTSPSTAST